MSREHHRDRIAAVRRQLAQDGPPWTREDADDFTKVTVPEEDCDAIRDLLIGEGVTRVIEVGLAYGRSALAIGEALVSVSAEEPVHVIIDPFQATAWANVGWNLLTSAGLDTIARLILQPSSLALPRLLAEGFTADAAFVDGSHRYHEVFVDLYFLRKIVRPGGLIIMDDYRWPSVQTAARYYETNLGCQVVEGALAGGGTVNPATGHPRMRVLRLPDHPFEPAFDEFKPFWFSQ
ncbi:class I SAM-dependent methyltransferase [Actinopolymorpha alba]|uniref:class I SAM-dependent methyltransferase n=1 Tax=Actinopolymorpha alba TaxID=533267 RepID=UPI00036255CA|nr:class I SAM-dependent methyltransferase [Actinopolymorpha alba]